jgi:hypothetical protein
VGSVTGEEAHVRRRLLILSLANWALALVCWTVSAYLGITSPASLFVYSLLFVVGLLGALVGIVAFLLSRYGTDPHEYLVTHPEEFGPPVEAAASTAPPAPGA